LDRLPFVLLFGIATSADSFEDRLSGQSLRYLTGERFDVTQSDDIIEKLFSATAANRDNQLFVGPNLCRRMLDRQKDYVQNVQDFCDGLKYAYMSHCYASIPTIFLNASPTMRFKEANAEAFEAVRNLPSFRRGIEAELSTGVQAVTGVRKLLESDQGLFQNICRQVGKTRDALASICHAAQVLSCIRESLQLTPNVRPSTVWIRAVSADLLESPLLRETMLALKKVTSDKMVHLLGDLSLLDDSKSRLQANHILEQLHSLLEQHGTSTPLRTQDDVRNDSVRTTVVAQKVLLSKHKAALSEQDKAYSRLVTQLHEGLVGFFSDALVDPNDLLYSEILMYDLKSPHLEVFQPKPRFSIERAMASPHDYLGCDCCGGVDGKESTLSITQPATAIVYQLYLESGALINVTDLWSAFRAIARDENDDDDDESKTM
jgi:origin recognition complex subunit 3